MKRQVVSAAIAATGLVLAASVAGCGAEDGVVTLRFFQYKGEAIEDFQQIVDEFEAANPDIRIEMDQAADSETAIRTLLVKDRVPDIITLNANGNFGKLAESGVFYDFSAEPVLQTINPSVQQILEDLGEVPGEVNGLGYVNNANGIIYNRQIFAEQGLEVPETWDELIAVCDKLQAAGIAPFAGTLADAWTGLPSWNGLGAYAAQDDFFGKLRAAGEELTPDSPTSFSRDFADVLARQAQLYQYTQDGYRGANYDDGSALFANGEAAMLLQGIWALSPVKKINPDIDAAIFPYPAPGGPDDRLLVTGVDIVVTMPKNAKHPREAMRFIEFMFSRDVIQRFAASQNMIPSVQGAQLPDDPAITSVAPYFADGRITGFIDHQVPAAIPLTNTVQQFLFDGDAAEALATLDKEWAKVAARTIPMQEQEEE